MNEITNKTSVETLLKILEREYKDKYETDEKVVGTPEYWKKAGVIELIQKLKSIINNQIERR